MRQMPPRELDSASAAYCCAREAFIGRLYKDGTVWPDGSPRWAIGFGHTCSAGEVAAYQDVTMTREQATDLFVRDAAARLGPLNAMIEVPVSEHEFGALFSLEFNIGSAALAASSVIAKLNAGDFDAAAAHFLDWVNWHASPGAPLTRSKGLMMRRKLDMEFFLMQDVDDQAWSEFIERTKQCQIDLTAELPSLLPGRHIHDDLEENV